MVPTSSHTDKGQAPESRCGEQSEIEGSAINVSQQGPFPVTIIMLMRL